MGVSSSLFHFCLSFVRLVPGAISVELAGVLFPGPRFLAPPGRLGDPSTTLARDDPRLGEVVTLLSKFGKF